MSAPTFAEGQLARVQGWHGFGRIVTLHLVRGEADVWWWSPNGRAAMRSVLTSRLRPARPSDVAPPRVPEMAAPSRRRAR